jgi:hypothetical protein
MRRTGLARNTIRSALRSDQPPAFRCPERPSKLDPYKDEIHRLLKDDPKLPGVRVREAIEPLGFDGGKTIVDDYLREIRPVFLRLRTHQRTVYRPGEICQWEGSYVKSEVVARGAVTEIGDRYGGWCNAPVADRRVVRRSEGMRGVTATDWSSVGG